MGHRRTLAMAAALLGAPLGTAFTGAAASAATTAPPPTSPPATATPAASQPDTSFLRSVAETDFASANPDAASIACAVPPADEAGVQFLCYGVLADGTVLVQQATTNDDGGIEFADAATPTTTVAPATTLPAPVQGSGTQVAPITPLSAPSILHVTHDGSGDFAVQLQAAGVDVGSPLVSATGAVDGRYLASLDGVVDALAITADGNWSVQAEPADNATVLADGAPASGSLPDVLAFDLPDGAAATVTFEGEGGISVTAITDAGSQTLASHTGVFTGPVILPAGPGFLAVNATGSWTIELGAATTAGTAVG